MCIRAAAEYGVSLLRTATVPMCAADGDLIAIYHKIIKHQSAKHTFVKHRDFLHLLPFSDIIFQNEHKWQNSSKVHLPVSIYLNPTYRVVYVKTIHAIGNLTYLHTTVCARDLFIHAVKAWEVRVEPAAMRCPFTDTHSCSFPQKCSVTEKPMGGLSQTSIA